MQEGSRGRVRAKGPSAPAANELWLQMAPLQWRGSVCRGAGLRNATPQLPLPLNVSPHALHQRAQAPGSSQTSGVREERSGPYYCP